MSVPVSQEVMVVNCKLIITFLVSLQNLTSKTAFIKATSCYPAIFMV